MKIVKNFDEKQLKAEIGDVVVTVQSSFLAVGVVERSLGGFTSTKTFTLVNLSNDCVIYESFSSLEKLNEYINDKSQFEQIVEIVKKDKAKLILEG